jgi:hypothetical protein
MKYWLFDGEDIIGPFAPYEIAERAGFSPDTLVCPEPDSEKENAWKPAHTFDDFSEENIKLAKEAAAAEKKTPEPQETATPDLVPASVPISQVSPEEEPLFSEEQSVKKEEPETAEEIKKEDEEPPTTHDLPLLSDVQNPPQTVSAPTEEITAQVPPLPAEEPLKSTPDLTEEIQEPSEEPATPEKVLTPKQTVTPEEVLTPQEPEAQTQSVPLSQVPPAEQAQTVSNHAQKGSSLSKKTFVKILLAVAVILLLCLAGCVGLFQKSKASKAAPVLQKETSPAPATQKEPLVLPPLTLSAPQTESAPTPKPVASSTPSAKVPSNIPVPPPPKQTSAPLQEKAINIVKNHPLSGNRGTVDTYLARVYNTQLSQGYQGTWSAELLHKNTYIVKYRLTKTRVEPIVYVFQADTQHEKLTGALNNITLDLIGKI